MKKTTKQATKQQGFEPTKVALAVSSLAVIVLLSFAIIAVVSSTS